MPRANRYFLPGYIWHIVALNHPWASRHKNFLVLSLWYTSTEKGNSALQSFVKRNKANPGIIQLARDLLARNKTAPQSGNVESYKRSKIDETKLSFV